MIRLVAVFYCLVSMAEIKVGAVFPMTGPIATYGQESVNGMKLALKEINKNRKEKIKLIVEDNKGEPIESANGVRKLINVDNVIGILGSVASSNTLAGAPIAQEKGVPLLTPASTANKVTEVGDYVSRICFTDSFQGLANARFAFNTLKARKALVVADFSSDYSKGLSKAFREEFKKLGGEIVSEDLAYQQKDVDFRSILRKVKRSKPDLVFVPGYYQEVGLMLKQARQLGIKVPFLGGDGWDSPVLQKLAGKGVKNTFISSHYSMTDPNPLVKKFVADYKKTYKANPGSMAALGYDGMLVLADAISRMKKKNDRTSLKEAINSTKDFKGVTGSITIDNTRNAVKGAVFLEVTQKGNMFKEWIKP